MLIADLPIRRAPAALEPEKGGAFAAGRRFDRLQRRGHRAAAEEPLTGSQYDREDKEPVFIDEIMRQNDIRSAGSLRLGQQIRYEGWKLNAR